MKIYENYENLKIRSRVTTHELNGFGKSEKTLPHMCPTLPLAKIDPFGVSNLLKNDTKSNQK